MFWILVFSYWIHLLATVIWFGSLVLMALAAWPALGKGAVAQNGWLALQKQLIPWANISLVLLLITGFVQMTNDVNYSGFLAIDSTWAWAMLVKHIAFGLLAALTVYLQFGLYPAADRIALLADKKPQLAKTEQQKLAQREKQVLWLNLACAVAILFCTAVATAV
ncbi:CopD family protein [Candidatus Leptofilum sp.]|uniref:CopD family protein n=1 Tax=Candidatus Leptofilum sp. TaxID=3241576 RepID=UPI003B58D4A3